MDNIAHINVKKDSTFAMMLAAQKRRHQLFTLDCCDLFVQNDIVCGYLRPTAVFDNEQHWFEQQQEQSTALTDMDLILMRKDPPFDIDYIYATYLLEKLEQQGVLVVNAPQALRDFNEKLVLLHFAKSSPKTLVSARIATLKAFIKNNKKVVVKPLDGMGGQDVFLLTDDDVNQSSVLAYLTNNNQRLIMAQIYLPEIAKGDKRILLIDGKPLPYALVRIPQQGELKGNLAAGASSVGAALTKRDYWLCQQVSPMLKKHRLLFVGLDVIGDFITEINITSPTGVRQLDEMYHLDIGGQLLDVIEHKLSQST